MKNYVIRDISELHNGNILMTTDVLDLHAKHVMGKNKTVLSQMAKWCESVGYDYVIWGSHKEHDTSNPLEVGYHELTIIMNMLNPEYNKPARVFRSSRGTLWADNTHSLIAYYIRNKILQKPTTLEHTPFYFVDTYDGKVVIYDYNYVVIRKEADIQEMIRKSYRLELREQITMRNFKWTLRDLMIELGLTL